MLQPEIAATAEGLPVRFAPPLLKFRKTPLKVIASSIRKGNIIEQDGKLYVVLSAENIHPGKGTPGSQIEMRRIGDGVKVLERYKTTDQVEKATVEDHNYNYLYEDADAFHFMNNDNYDQVQVDGTYAVDSTMARAEGDVSAADIEWGTWTVDENVLSLTADAARFITGMNMKCVGIDSPSIESYNCDGTVHRELLSKGCIIIELLNLSNVREGNYTLVALPLPFAGLDGSPARVVLIENNRATMGCD